MPQNVVAERSKGTCNLSTDCSHRRTQVQIPTQDYEMDRSEVEILCRIQIAGRRVICVAYDIEPNVDVIRHVHD